jgi:ribosomal protein S18 acetylase RimI-like enzyme
MAIEIRRVGPGDTALVVAARDLFDEPPDPATTDRFLTTAGHHLFLALEDGVPAGFVSGVETSHPDKGTEMLLYELSVAEHARRRGIGRQLVEALRRLAVERGCYGMWVLTETDNVAALATYRGTGARDAEHPVLLDWDPQGERRRADEPPPG